MHIGIDLGGTNIAAALVGSDGEIVSRVSIRTDTQGGTQAVIEGLSRVVQMLLEGSDILPESIGIGVPGTVNNKTGEVLFTPNLPISGVNIVRELQRELQPVLNCPIHLGNDANCAALGEVIAGCAKGVGDAIFITLGTGIGGGIIMDGKLYTGFNGAAGELGHMLIIDGGRKCGCGREGCWETYASATGLVRTAEEIISCRPSSLLWSLRAESRKDSSSAQSIIDVNDRSSGVAQSILGSISHSRAHGVNQSDTTGLQHIDVNNSNLLDGRMIFDAYRKGDDAAKEIVDIYVTQLAAGVVNLINIFEPEILCIAGGISNAWDCLKEPLEAIVNAQCYTRAQPHTQQTCIEKTSLGGDAGIIGAAYLHTSK